VELKKPVLDSIAQRAITSRPVLPPFVVLAAAARAAIAADFVLRWDLESSE
jgi:hypothetical protein